MEIKKIVIKYFCPYYFHNAVRLKKKLIQLQNNEWVVTLPKIIDSHFS